MMSPFLFCAVFVASVSSQCDWTVNITGGTKKLNLEPLKDVPLVVYDIPLWIYNYSVCSNGVTCEESEYDNMMVSQQSTDPRFCYALAFWYPNNQPTYNADNGGTWKFKYYGPNDCGQPQRLWEPTFVCDPSTEYSLSPVQEPESCVYTITIKTKYACDDYTTTTLQPDNCRFTSFDGNNTLDMSSLRGELISSVDNASLTEYFMYTPCENTAKCGDDERLLAMAYIFDGVHFECKQYLAVWENGLTQPNYIKELGLWQFTYTNGERCEASGGNNVFIVEWVCDLQAEEVKVVQAQQIGACVYQMVLNSVIACG